MGIVVLGIDTWAKNLADVAWWTGSLSRVELHRNTYLSNPSSAMGMIGVELSKAFKIIKMAHLRVPRRRVINC